MQNSDPQLQPAQPAAAPTPLPPAVPQQALSALLAGQPANSSSAAAVAHTRQLIQQYRANPFQFSVAFEQLKARHIATTFNIDPSRDKK